MSDALKDVLKAIDKAKGSDTIVYSLAPVARFALGLADEVAIMDSPELYNYVQKFIEQHIKSLFCDFKVSIVTIESLPPPTGTTILLFKL